MTQIVQPTDLRKAFAGAISEEIPIERDRSHSEVTSQSISNEDPISNRKNSPYNKFEAKTLVRHPSLTRQDSKQLSPRRESPPAATLQHAVSSPALQKLFNEDNEFGEDLRNRAELKDKVEGRRRHLRKLKPSFEMQKSIENDLVRNDEFTPGRPSTPQGKKKLLVKPEIEFDNDSADGLKGISVDISIDEDTTKIIPKEDSESKQKAKKKKFVLKKKKEKIIQEVIPEEKEVISSPEITRAVSPTILVLEDDIAPVADDDAIGKDAVDGLGSDAEKMIAAGGAVATKQKELKDKKKSKAKKEKSEKKEKHGKEKKKKTRKEKNKTDKEEEDPDWVMVDFRGKYNFHFVFIAKNNSSLRSVIKMNFR